MQDQKRSGYNYLIFASKLTLAALVLWYVFTSLDSAEIWQNIKSAEPLFLFLAALALLASTLVSAARMGIYLNMPRKKAVPLYYKGMFFNTMLPGGVSGDGYIAYHLKKRHKRDYKSSIRLLLLNRANGLFFLNLIFYGCIMASDYWNLPYVPALVATLFILQMPVYFFIARKWLGEDWALFFKTAPYSIALQSFTVLTAVFVFMALGVGGHLMEYICQFSAASIAAIVPVTPGGMGIREFVFYKGSKLISADAEFAVASSLVYFTLYMLMSQIGIYFLLRTQEKK